MSKKQINQIPITSILILILISQILCADDTIYLTVFPYLFMDKAKPRDIFFYFDYYEGYYRAIHPTYDQWPDTSVKMKYLGDSSKDFFVECYISPNRRDSISGGKYHYNIPSTLEDVSILKPGTYCIEIVKKLIGDIKSGDYCSNNYNIKIIDSNEYPKLAVTGFSEDQNEYVSPKEKITLLATVKNKMSITQDYDKIGINISNTEIVTSDIPLDCKIEGNKPVDSVDKIICIIPDSTPQGIYTVKYILNWQEIKILTPNLIDSFNSLDFPGEIKKLSVINIVNIYSKLENISFENPSKFSGLFNLTFYINGVQNIDDIVLENYTYKDLGIYLIGKNGGLINTKCNLIKNQEKGNIFYLICTPSGFNREMNYSIVIKEDYSIGYDKSGIIYHNEKPFYSIKIQLSSAEFSFFVVYDYEGLPYLNCNPYGYGYYFNVITRVNHLCSSCGKNCLTCKDSYTCTKCLDGFTLIDPKECLFVKDNINYKNFKDVEKFIPQDNSCESTGNYKQLFSFEFSYIITNGENLVIESERYNNIIFTTNTDRKYELNCVIDVNPSYIQKDPVFGTCKKSICDLVSFVNCSFNDIVPNGIYEIEVNPTNDFGKLVDRALAEYAPIQITFKQTSISGNNLDDSIQVIYNGYKHSSNNISLCANVNSQEKDCFKIKNCIKSSENDEETIYQCSKDIYYYEDTCKLFEAIMMKDSCGKNVYAYFEYEYCPDNYNNIERINYANLLLLSFSLLFLS